MPIKKMQTNSNDLQDNDVKNLRFLAALVQSTEDAVISESLDGSNIIQSPLQKSNPKMGSGQSREIYPLSGKSRLRLVSSRVGNYSKPRVLKESD